MDSLKKFCETSFLLIQSGSSLELGTVTAISPLQAEVERGYEDTILVIRSTQAGNGGRRNICRQMGMVYFGIVVSTARGGVEADAIVLFKIL